MLRRKTTKTKTLGQDTKERYLKNIVRVRPPKSGKISQRKFYLSHDEDAARHAPARIDALWNCVEGRFQRQHHQRMIQQSFPVPHRPQPEYELVDGARQVKPYVPNVVSMMRVAAMLVVLFTWWPRPAFTQESEKAPPTVQEMTVRDRLAKKELQQFKIKVKELDAKYAKEWNSLQKDLAGKLESLRKEAMRSDELDAAVEIRDLINAIEKLEIQPPQAAPSKNHGTKKSTPDQKRQVMKAIAGQWSGQFDRSKSALRLEISENGVVEIGSKKIDVSKITFFNGRILVFTKKPMEINEHLELIPISERLVVLGWSRQKREHPQSDPASVVAILSR